MLAESNWFDLIQFWFDMQTLLVHVTRKAQTHIFTALVIEFHSRSRTHCRSGCCCCCPFYFPFDRYTIICDITYAWFWLPHKRRNWSITEVWCRLQSPLQRDMAERRRRSTGNSISIPSWFLKLYTPFPHLHISRTPLISFVFVFFLLLLLLNVICSALWIHSSLHRQVVPLFSNFVDLSFAFNEAKRPNFNENYLSFNLKTHTRKKISLSVYSIPFHTTLLPLRYFNFVSICFISKDSTKRRWILEFHTNSSRAFRMV